MLIHVWDDYDAPLLEQPAAFSPTQLPQGQYKLITQNTYSVQKSNLAISSHTILCGGGNLIY